MTPYDVIGAGLSGAPRPSISLMRSRQERKASRLDNSVHSATLKHGILPAGTASSIIGYAILSIVPHRDMALCTCWTRKQSPLDEARGYEVMLNLQKQRHRGADHDICPSWC